MGRSAGVDRELLRVLSEGPLSVREIAKKLQISEKSVRERLANLLAIGTVKRIVVREKGRGGTKILYLLSGKWRPGRNANRS